MSNKTARIEPFLTQVDRLIDWAPLTSLMQAIRVRIRADVPLPVLKLLLLARWYGASEAPLREALQDRISFRRFLGLRLDDLSNDAVLVETFRCIVTDAPEKAQALIHSVETQLLMQGLTVTAGRWVDAATEPILKDAMLLHASAGKTTVFQPGEMTKLGGHADVVARSGEQVAGNPSLVTGSESLQPLPALELPPVRSTIEWPWGVTTDLIEDLNIGREFGFCPYARELQVYRHVSRKHAELVTCSEGIWVRDLRSRNGTFVNDEEVPKGQARLVETDSSLRFGSNFVILLNFEH